MIRETHHVKDMRVTKQRKARETILVIIDQRGVSVEKEI